MPVWLVVVWHRGGLWWYGPSRPRTHPLASSRDSCCPLRACARVLVLEDARIVVGVNSVAAVSAVRRCRCRASIDVAELAFRQPVLWIAVLWLLLHLLRVFTVGFALIRFLGEARLVGWGSNVGDVWGGGGGRMGGMCGGRV